MMSDTNNLFAGIDVGSLTAKAVIMDDRGRLLAGEIMPVRPRVEQSAHEIFEKALRQGKVKEERVVLCYSTGYGRDAIPFATKNISEISCHGHGAHFLCSDVRTVIDVGGQDCKVVRVDGEGYLQDFVMNDKCAAGTGRFLEMMARTLGVSISELGPLALHSRKQLSISSQCTIFAEMEVFQHLYSGCRRRDIAQGVHAALARRVKTLAGRVGVVGEVCVTGGVSKNTGIVSCLEKELGVSFTPLPVDPQIVGALGAALFALEAWQARAARDQSAERSDGKNSRGTGALVS